MSCSPLKLELIINDTLVSTIGNKVKHTHHLISKVGKELKLIMVHDSETMQLYKGSFHPQAYSVTELTGSGSELTSRFSEMVPQCTNNVVQDSFQFSTLGLAVIYIKKKFTQMMSYSTWLANSQ